MHYNLRTCCDIIPYEKYIAIQSRFGINKINQIEVKIFNLTTALSSNLESSATKYIISEIKKFILSFLL